MKEDKRRLLALAKRLIANPKTPKQEAEEIINLFFDEKLQGLIGVDKARNMAIKYAIIYINGKLSITPQYKGELNPDWQQLIHVKMEILDYEKEKVK